MKRMIAGAILALPLVIAGLPIQRASASDVIINPHFYSQATRPTLIARGRRAWVAGRWNRSSHRRVWVPGHYEYR